MYGDWSRPLDMVYTTVPVDKFIAPILQIYRCGHGGLSTTVGTTCFGLGCFDVAAWVRLHGVGPCIACGQGRGAFLNESGLLPDAVALSFTASAAVCTSLALARCMWTRVYLPALKYSTGGCCCWYHWWHDPHALFAWSKLLVGRDAWDSLVITRTVDVMRRLSNAHRASVYQT